MFTIPSVSYTTIAAAIALTVLGYSIGKTEGLRQAAEARADTEIVRTELANYRKAHAEEMTILQGKNLDLIKEAVELNSKKFREETNQLRASNAEYQRRLDEINTARLNAGTVISTAGMWIDVEKESCRTGSGGSYSGGDSKEGTSAIGIRGYTTSRCRLSNSSAEFLVALMVKADTVAEKFNLCRSEIRTVNLDVPDATEPPKAPPTKEQK